MSEEHEAKIAELDERLSVMARHAANLTIELAKAQKRARVAESAAFHAVNQRGEYDANFKKAVEARARRMVRPMAEETQRLGRMLKTAIDAQSRTQKPQPVGLMGRVLNVICPSKRTTQ